MNPIDVMGGMSLHYDFSKAKHITENLDKHLEDYRTDFDKIKELANKPVTDTNYNATFQLLLNIVDAIPLMITPLDTRIPVVRSMENNCNSIFSEQTRMSYHPVPRSVSAGRFNAPGISLFYGSLPVPGSELDFMLTSCLECCKGLSSKENPVEYQIMTAGVWKLMAALPMVNLCIDDVHLKTNPTLKEATDGYLKMLKENLSPNAFDFTLAFITYFSGLSRLPVEENKTYHITTALFTAIRYYYISKMDIPFAGLIYPSSVTEGEGLNVAMVPYAVDYCLKLKKVGMFDFVYDNANRTFDGKPCCDLAEVVDGHFKITGYAPRRSLRWIQE